MTRLRFATAMATAVSALLVLLVPVGTAAAAPAALPTAVVASTLSDAKAISKDARALRSEVAAMLGSYLTTYVDRFSEDERTQLTEFKANADRQLAVVVVTANRLRNTIADGGTRAQIRTATRAAQTAQKRAKATAETSFAQARVIVEPKLSLFEGLQALSDYSRMMDRFDALGDDIDAVAKVYR